MTFSNASFTIISASYYIQPSHVITIHTYLSLLLCTQSLVFKFEVVDTLIYLVAEQIVENTIRSCNNDVTILQFLLVVIRMLGLVLAHGVVKGTECLSQLLEFFDTSLFLEELEFLLTR